MALLDVFRTFNKATLDVTYLWLCLMFSFHPSGFVGCFHGFVGCFTFHTDKQDMLSKTNDSANDGHLQIPNPDPELSKSVMLI